MPRRSQGALGIEPFGFAAAGTFLADHRKAKEMAKNRDLSLPECLPENSVDRTAAIARE